MITDWLSAKEKKWGENIERLVELENLALFPESEDSYVHLLKNSGFKLISALDDSLAYLGYNQDIVKRLQNLSLSQNSCFNEIELDASTSGYESIAKAIEVGELRVLRFVVQKN